MDIIGIIFIVIIVGFVVFGLIRGFFNSLISLIRWILSFIVSAFISAPLASMLVKTPMCSGWANGISTSLEAKGGIFVQTYSGDIGGALFDEMKLPEMVKPLFSKLINAIADSLAYKTGVENTVAEVLGTTIIYYAMIVAVFIVSFIIIQIICFLLKKFFKTISRNNVVGAVDKLLGAVLNGIVGLFIVYLITYIISFVIVFENPISTWLSTQMQLGTDVPTISKFFYENNLIAGLISWIQGLFA